MSKVRFMWDNEADVATITSSSEHVNFLDDQVAHRWHTRPWRSRYGAGSGWGNFNIWANVSDRLDFEETAGVNLAAILTVGAYTADSLCAHLKAQMEAVGGSTYTWEYLDASNKFKVTSNGAGGGGILNLEWATGPNTARSIGTTIGFDISADDVGALTYTADNMRIHHREYLKFDVGTSATIMAVVIKNNNLQSGATLVIQANATDVWTAPTYTYTFGTIDNDVMVLFITDPDVRALRYWRIFITDVDNPDGYVEMGRVFLGSYFSSARGFKEGYSGMIIDPSDVMMSKGGQVSSNEEEEYESVDVEFPVATSDFTTFKSIFNDRGIKKDMFVTLDTDNFATETYYMRFAGQFNYHHIYNREYYWVRVQLEELR